MQKRKNLYIQEIRAVLILFVIIMHTIYESDNNLENYMLIMIRQICNVAVPVFFFISGYFLNLEKINNKAYIYTKIMRLVIPLIIWNIIYFIINKTSIIKLVAFQTAPHLYFIIVLVQLILLSPIIYKYVNKKALLMITPIYLMLYRGLLLKYNFSIPLHQFWVFGWLIYYVLGIKSQVKKANTTKYTYISLLCWFIIEMAYQYTVYKQIDFNRALSQMNIINMITSILLIKCIEPIFTNKNTGKNNLLTDIGDYSFGIYFLHLLVLKIIKHIVSTIFDNTIIIIVLSSAITLLACYVAIKQAKKWFPKKINEYIGF